MKFFRYTLVAAATAMALGFTACSDDDDYVPGQPGDGVYFPSDQSTTVSLETASTGFTVNVARAGLTEAATYNLVGTVTSGGATLDAETNPFVLPSTVTFAEGATTATISVACNGADLVTETPYQVSFALADGTPGFNYGNGTITLTVTRLSAWGEWEAYGDGLATYNYTLGVFSGLQGDDPDLPISIRQNTENPDLHQFHVEHWAFNVDLYINWDSKTNLCTIEPQQMGGQVNMGDDVGVLDVYYCTLYPYFSDDAAKFGSYFNPETGEFELAIAYTAINPEDGQLTLLNGLYGLEYLTCGKYGDTSISFSYDGTLTDADGNMSAQFTATIGADASKAIFGVSQDLDANGLLQAMLAGAVPVVESAPGTDVTVKIPVSTAGAYTAVAITLDGEDQPANAVYTTFEVFGGNGNSGSWKNVATVDFIDGWVMPQFGFGNEETGEEIPYNELGWQVQGQESVETPGLYRLKSPWTNQYSPLVYNNVNSNTKSTDLYIDATNPECVKIYPQYSGMTYVHKTQGTFEFYIANAAGFFIRDEGVSEEEVIAQGYGEPMVDGYIQINPCIFGYSLEDFGYYDPSLNPTAEIYFDFSSPDISTASKVKGKNVTVTPQNFRNCIRSNFRIPAVRQQKRSFERGPVTFDVRTAFHYVIK